MPILIFIFQSLNNSGALNQLNPNLNNKAHPLRGLTRLQFEIVFIRIGRISRLQND